jgi:acetyl esterase
MNLRGWLILMTFFTIASRAEMRPDIEYGRVGELRLFLDAHIPNGPGPHPAVILVHGGGWVRGNRKDTMAPLFAPLSDAGFAWFSISYRLIGEIRGKNILGTAEDDVRNAVLYVKDHAAEFRIDPDRVALIGDSAGGQLACMAALQPGSRGAVKAVVSLYGPNDLASIAQNAPQIPEEWRDKIMASPWGDVLMSGLKSKSPINYLHAGMPPFLLIHGTKDPLVPYEQSVTLCNRIEKAGGSCTLFSVEGGGHGLRGWEARQLTSYKAFMVRWLQQKLGSTSAALSGSNGR